MVSSTVAAAEDRLWRALTKSEGSTATLLLAILGLTAVAFVAWLLMMVALAALVFKLR
jgi:hypothetical protein